ncbi:hypothetical protein [Denitromonas halophila]|uniref:Uncharacterized protein n=1 Tax=Denitromonas halophila TaxID=1629404 RepID=A0A557R2B3_9RHOO|nr:hypothetical protein [Denitromonas halophila]TVO59299.1 hypothetical protein FHP91_00860 [Denitromonas halophila]
MKLAKRFFIPLPPVLLAIALGVGQPALAANPPADDKASVEHISQESEDLMKALKAYTVKQRNEALKKSQAALDTLDRRIEALEAQVDQRWDKMDQAARDKARASLKALREQRREVATWFGSMRDGSVEAWEEVKDGFTGAYQALQDAWKNTEKDVAAGDKKKP